MLEVKIMKYAIIHIADIHYRKGEPEGAETIFKWFINDLKSERTKLEGYEIYLAATGDIVYEGKDSESYTEFISKFDHLLSENKIGIDSRIMVPGNHDVDRNIVKEDIKNREIIISQYKDERTFNNYFDKKLEGNKKFDNYKIFESYFVSYGIDTNSNGKGWIINNDLGVYCLNSALCSFGGLEEIDDTGNLAIQTRDLVDWCNKQSSTTNILLMHHPLSHLNEWSRRELKIILENHFSLCLCGHNHEQDISYNKFYGNALICSAPQLFTNKSDQLGYGIICIENNQIKEIRYRQYVKGAFLNGQQFSGNDTGIIVFDSRYKRSLEYLEKNLSNSLAFFKGQSNSFVRPILSKERVFNENGNLLDDVIKNPKNYQIISQPQFGLTCLAHYMRLEAFILGSFWIYINATNTKSRSLENVIEIELQQFGIKADDIKCFVIDSWDGSQIDHRNLVNKITDNYKNVPLIVMSNYTDNYFSSQHQPENITKKFDILHLQALQRNKVRELVKNYKNISSTDTEDNVVAKLVSDLEALNIHRTPLNCLILLRVFEDNFHRELINRTKLIKTVLFILFTDTDSFTYSSTKPEVEDCEYILGKFCKTLIQEKITKFEYSYFLRELNNYCKEKYLKIDIDILIDILLSNNILLRYENYLMFKHTYWIYYFASVHMMQDSEFESYILQNKNYVNFPEIIEFFTGQDGKRESAINTILNDLEELIETVNTRIGIRGEFNPFKGAIWNPSGQAIEQLKKEISDKVQESQLPTEIKDQHADTNYNSESPYNQSIKDFMNKYSILSLMSAIKASSRALRNSNYIDAELKVKFISSIFRAWEQMSRVIFWISPVLARDGSVFYDGWSLLLIGNTAGTDDERLKNVYLSNPTNVVNYFKDPLSSKKLGPLVIEKLVNNDSQLQQHLITLFLIRERPLDWNTYLFDFVNSLHRNSFFLADVQKTILDEMQKGFTSDEEKHKLKSLLKIIAAKHIQLSKSKLKEIPEDMIINESNKLPLDKILAEPKGPKHDRYNNVILS